MDAPPLNQDELTEVYNWVDQIPLSRPKKNITRDFADGVMLAEIIAHYFPKLVEIHNYIASTSATNKLSNWNTLNIHINRCREVSKTDIEHIITCTPDIIERVLRVTQNKIRHHIDKKNQVVNKQDKQPDFKKIAQNQQLKDVILEKDNTIKELKSTVQILELKIQKMEKLIKLKDDKIQTLITKLQQAGIV